MKIAKAQILLIIIFATGFVIEIGIAFYSHNILTDDELINLLTKIFAIYSIHLTVIAGSIFGSKKEADKTPPEQDVSKTAFSLAVGLSLLWNILLLWRFFIFLGAALDTQKEGGIGALISYIDKIAIGGSFLVTGMLAYFFTSESPSNTSKLGGQ